MLSKLLSKEECAKCRICCCFDSTDLWETPVVSQGLRDRILDDYPEMRFVEKGESYLFRMDKEPDEDLYYCSVLDHQKGCVLGDEKPFDCRIWPFRVMEFNGQWVITLSPVCPNVIKKPLDEIQKVAKEIAPIIFAEANRNPDIVKKYLPNYPILVTEI